MVLKLKLRKIGNSVGIVLPKKLLAHMKAGAGDALSVTKTQDGIFVTAKKSEFAKAMAVFGRVSRRYRNTLRELAK